jgi:membrane-bound serine protease (ClpP class)
VSSRFRRTVSAALLTCGLLLWVHATNAEKRPGAPAAPPREHAGHDAPVPPAVARPAEDPEAQEKLVDLIVVDAGINPATADFIHESLATAAHDGARALIIELDTPGGLLDSTKSMVKDLLGAPVPVIVYIAPSGAGAASAGVFVTMAAHIAAMAPGTNIGAAHPVGGQGEDIGGDMREKVENFTVSLSKTIAQERGRNVDWAEKAVRESVSVTEQEALKLHVIDLVAADLDDLLRQADGREVSIRGSKVKLDIAGAEIAHKDMRFKQKFLNILANPNIAYLLMMAGILGLYVEFTHPGVFFPGIAGGICLLLALTALQVLPINYSGLALLVLGIALLVSELFVPSFGILGVGGLVSFVLGSLLLFDTPGSNLTVDPNIVYAAAATFGGFTLLVSYLVVRSQRRKPMLGREGLIGEIGEVRQRIGEGGGKIFVHGEYWNAAAAEPIEIGERAEVLAVEGIRLTVRRVPSKKETAQGT